MEKQAVQQWMEEHYQQNPTVIQMARHFAYEICYFQRKFKRMFGVSPKQYLINLRLDEARRLLVLYGDRMDWVWRSLGFCTQSKFSSQFKRRFGLSPVEYQRLVGIEKAVASR